jgi:hypothetical protein
MLNVKKLIRTTVLSTVILASAMTSYESKAVVGLFISPAVVVAGLIVGGGSYLGGVAIATSGGLDRLAGGVLIAFYGAIVGAVILDGENGQTLQFSELSSEQASTLNISEEARSVYNGELDQANSLISDVTSQLSQLENPTAEDSVAAWSKLKDSVSSETYSTMQKIVSQ